MFSNKGKKDHVIPANPKAGYVDRAVGRLKQMAGRAFDEPGLYEKGKNQAKFGSQVVVHDRPMERHRPWTQPSDPLKVPPAVQLGVEPHHNIHPEPLPNQPGVTNVQHSNHPEPLPNPGNSDPNALGVQPARAQTSMSRWFS